MFRKILYAFIILISTKGSAEFYYEDCFTPGQNCTQLIVNAINEAHHSVLVQAYSFTSVPIAAALVGAEKRGVEVKIILDKSQRRARYSSSKFLMSQKIPIWIDYKVVIAHNKVIIIDNKEVITGSFNFTRAAQYKNAENVIFVKESKIVKDYKKNWYRREKLSAALNY